MRVREKRVRVREKDREKCLRRWGPAKIKRKREAQTKMRKMKRNESSFEFHKVTDRKKKIHFKVCWGITERNETDGEVKQEMWRLTAEEEQDEGSQQEGWSGGEEERSLASSHCVLRLGSWSMRPLWLMTAQFSTRYTAETAAKLLH